MKSMIEEIGLDRVNELLAEATAKAARKSDELGLPHAVKIDGVWCRQYPDGHVESFDFPTPSENHTLPSRKSSKAVRGDVHEAIWPTDETKI